ncbi:hypothetical protein THRCLA_11629 [Thraustotheca clavata]|uniref:C2 domain-containing protein n=1 Tax=Thraustotheca clavata TaxID=74557 RepID=A0A1V9Y764_9STRA|nr:hypothetical protein THRCLA_11629 [Thraustotheca clavata]
MLLLEVRVRAARNLIVLDAFRTLSPFCKGSLNSQKLLTSVDAHAGNMPHWFDTMTFTIKDMEKDILQIQVFDSDDIPRGMLGACLFPVRDWKIGQLYDRWYPLFHGTMYAGELHVAVQIFNREDEVIDRETALTRQLTDVEAEEPAPEPPTDIKPRFLPQPGYPAFTALSIEELMRKPSTPSIASTAHEPEVKIWSHPAQPRYPGYPQNMSPFSSTSDQWEA